MKKTLLCVVALLLSVTAINAQKVDLSGNASNLFSRKSNAPVQNEARKAMFGPSRINLDANERILGFYDTDELDMTGQSSLGMNIAPGTYTVGLIFTPDMIGNFAGGTMTKLRFAVAESIGQTTVTVSPVEFSGNSYSIGDAVATQTVASTVAGWNDVTLNTPVTLEANMGYMITYTYPQESKYNPYYGVYTASSYPLLVDLNVNSLNTGDPYGFMFNDGTRWDLYGAQGFGNICIQAVVSGGSFIDNDITLNSIVPESTFYKGGETANFTYVIKNNGNNTPSSYTLNVSVDGNVISTLTTPVALTNSLQTAQASVQLPSDLAAGSHTLSLSVASINGSTPTENVDDDEVSTTMNIYTASVARQKNLVEQFTSTFCTACPYAVRLLNAIQNLRGDLVIIAAHSTGMGPDPFITDASDIYYDMMGNGYFPCATFNRYYSDSSLNKTGTLTLTIGYDESYARRFSEEVIDPSNDLPSFATVDIATSYNSDTRQLTVTVSGEAVDGFTDFVGDDAVLTVSLTEDGLVAYQAGGSANEVHNNVLRDVLTATWGDLLQWTDGNHYSNTYTVTLDSEWNADNMHVVAFVGRPVADQSYIDDVWVNNANVAKVGGNSTGISGVVTPDENATEVARYSIDGRQISKAEKGINIIKMSDGTIRKVIVK